MARKVIRWLEQCPFCNRPRWKVRDGGFDWLRKFEMGGYKSFRYLGAINVLRNKNWLIDNMIEKVITWVKVLIREKVIDELALLRHSVKEKFERGFELFQDKIIKVETRYIGRSKKVEMGKWTEVGLDGIMPLIPSVKVGEMKEVDL